MKHLSLSILLLFITLSVMSQENITINIPGIPVDAKPLEMIYIKAGTFMMGSPANERGHWSGEWQPHEVTLTNDFYLGTFEVTQAQWQAVMGNNPSNFKTSTNHPVEQVSWNDIQGFIQRMNEMGIGDFRLPTEAEWEYAARAGTSTRFSHGDVLDCGDSCESCAENDQYMWWCGNSSSQTHEVGLTLPNPWGLFDMHGNVWEWCQDNWQESSNRGVQVDPIIKTTDSRRVIRGGSWSATVGKTRSSYRSRINSTGKSYKFGFRLARTIE